MSNREYLESLNSYILKIQENEYIINDEDIYYLKFNSDPSVYHTLIIFLRRNIHQLKFEYLQKLESYFFLKRICQQAISISFFNLLFDTNISLKERFFVIYNRYTIEREQDPLQKHQIMVIFRNKDLELYHTVSIKEEFNQLQKEFIKNFNFEIYSNDLIKTNNFDKAVDLILNQINYYKDDENFIIYFFEEIVKKYLINLKNLTRLKELFNDGLIWGCILNALNSNNEFRIRSILSLIKNISINYLSFFNQYIKDRFVDTINSEMNIQTKTKLNIISSLGLKNLFEQRLIDYIQEQLSNNESFNAINFDIVVDRMSSKIFKVLLEKESFSLNNFIRLMANYFFTHHGIRNQNNLKFLKILIDSIEDNKYIFYLFDIFFREDFEGKNELQKTLDKDFSVSPTELLMNDQLFNCYFNILVLLELNKNNLFEDSLKKRDVFLSHLLKILSTISEKDIERTEILNKLNILALYILVFEKKNSRNYLDFKYLNKTHHIPLQNNKEFRILFEKGLGIILKNYKSMIYHYSRILKESNVLFNKVKFSNDDFENVKLIFNNLRELLNGYKEINLKNVFELNKTFINKDMDIIDLFPAFDNSINERKENVLLLKDFNVTPLLKDNFCFSFSNAYVIKKDIFRIKEVLDLSNILDLVYQESKFEILNTFKSLLKLPLILFVLIKLYLDLLDKLIAIFNVNSTIQKLFQNTLRIIKISLLDDLNLNLKQLITLNNNFIFRFPDILMINFEDRGLLFKIRDNKYIKILAKLSKFEKNAVYNFSDVNKLDSFIKFIKENGLYKDLIIKSGNDLIIKKPFDVLLYLTPKKNNYFKDN